MKQDPKRHHYVPEFLIKQWSILENTNIVRGYFFDINSKRVNYREAGSKSFCHRNYLYTTEVFNKKNASIETITNQYIDSEGAKVCYKILNHGIGSISPSERRIFSMLIISFTVRHPKFFHTLKMQGGKQFREGLDSDTEIWNAAQDAGIMHSPSIIQQTPTGTSLEDQAAHYLYPKLLDNPRIGKVMINAHWGTKTLSTHDGYYTLSDRPLTKGGQNYDDPSAVWIFPLSPRVAFVASNNYSLLNSLLSSSPRQFRNWLKGTSKNLAVQPDPVRIAGVGGIIRSF